jgi:hypothetical protein
MIYEFPQNIPHPNTLLSILDEDMPPGFVETQKEDMPPEHVRKIIRQVLFSFFLKVL